MKFTHLHGSNEELRNWGLFWRAFEGLVFGGDSKAIEKPSTSKEWMLQNKTELGEKK